MDNLAAELWLKIDQIDNIENRRIGRKLMQIPNYGICGSGGLSHNLLWPQANAGQVPDLPDCLHGSTDQSQAGRTGFEETLC